MNKLDQIKSLEEKREALDCNLVQLDSDLRYNADEVKKIEEKIRSPYSFGANLFMIIISIAITSTIVFLLLKWWINTDFSILIGVLLFLVTALSLVWNIFAIVNSTKKSYDKDIAEYNNKLETLLNEKEELIAKKYKTYEKIAKINESIINIEKEEKNRLAEEERQRKAELETRFHKVISCEKIDRNELTAIADAGHINAKIEMAKLLIDDYFSKMLTKEEKEQLASTVYKYLKGINTENDVEIELLELFSYTMSSCLEGGISMKSNLKKIRAIKDNNTLSKKYDSLANKMIQHIVSVIDGHDHSGGSSINYSYLTKNDDVSSSLCAYYQNGCCKHGYNANYNNISCGYSECFHSVCPNYQKR